MFVYTIWFNSRDSKRNGELVQELRNFLKELKAKGFISEFRIMRRSLGFGPEGLGEFNVMVFTESLGNLQKIMEEIEKGEVGGHDNFTPLVRDFKSALYREVEE